MFNKVCETINFFDRFGISTEILNEHWHIYLKNCVLLGVHCTKYIVEIQTRFIITRNEAQNESCVESSDSEILREREQPNISR